MFYLVYKTINLINKKYYIGAHTTTNKNDNYLGSGKTLKRAVKKYGKDNFTKTILYEAKSLQEMYNFESKEIQKSLSDPLCYNLNNGGKGGFHYINDNKLNIGDNNVMRKNLKAKNKCIEQGKLTKLKNLQKYKKIAIQNLQKAIEKNKGKKRPEHSIFMSNWAKNQWKQNREKNRDALSSTFLLISPDGKQIITNRLTDFCKENNLPFVSIWNSSVTNKKIKKGKAKNWLCKKI